MFRYCHTAFSFNKEASINTNPFYGNHADKIPPNALVSFMQKAMIYIYLEYHTDDITGEQILCDESFSFFRKHNCFRKLGQTHGLPLSHSNFTHTDDKDQLDKSNVNNNSSAVKSDFGTLLQLIIIVIIIYHLFVYICYLHINSYLHIYINWYHYHYNVKTAIVNTFIILM